MDKDKGKKNDWRTSSGAFVNRLKHEIVNTMHIRAALVTRSPVANQEQLHILRYVRLGRGELLLARFLGLGMLHFVDRRVEIRQLVLPDAASHQTCAHCS